MNTELLTEFEALKSLWRGLASQRAEEGVVFIPFSRYGLYSVRLIKLFPNSLEGISFDFRALALPPDTSLPQGRGFTSTGKKLFPREEGTWFSILRRDDGLIDLFSSMVMDLCDLLKAHCLLEPSFLLNLLIRRIFAWQRFMEKPDRRLLSFQEEVGLYGELSLLWILLEEYADWQYIINSWIGPSDGAHDFEFEFGDFEVKSFLGSSDFVAHISSLEQLSTLGKTFLYLVGFRLETSSDGCTLGNLIERIRIFIQSDAVAVADFESKLLEAGVSLLDISRFSMTFRIIKIDLFSVDDEFPRLIRGNVPSETVAASYSILLDHVPKDPISFHCCFLN